MSDTRKPLDEHWIDPDQLELADQAWDQIDHLLDALVQKTACSNEAIRDLLGAIACSWPDPHEQLALEARINSRHGGRR